MNMTVSHQGDDREKVGARKDTDGFGRALIKSQHRSLRFCLSGEQGSNPGFRDANLRVSLLPRYSRIEARYAEAAIGVLPRDIQLPDRLGTVGLRDFHNLRVWSAHHAREIKLQISGAENSSTPTPGRVQTWRILP